MSLAPGTRLGHYGIVSAIGAGGMGEVYRARDTRLDRDVAIKVLPAAFATDADRLARFEREAKAVAALSHPNVVAIFDTGTHDGRMYVVTELLEGETLRDRLRGGPLPVRKTTEHAVQLARGLAAAHDRGLVHRDLKPENVFLLNDGQIKILDFGLARQAMASSGSGATQTVAAMTDPGTVMGTVGYMSPEQVRGLPVDARSDLFALGAVLHEMLSGQRAFQRETAADTLTAVLTQDPPDLGGLRPEISPALERIVRHCLEKNPAERFQTARDVAFALDGLSGSSATAAAAMSGSLPAVPGVSPRRRTSPLLVAAGIMAVAGIAWAAGHFGAGPAAPTSTAISDVTYKPVTFEEGFLFAARFAPDGRTIVYSADWDQQPRGVYVTSLDSPEFRPLGFPGADLLALSRSGELAILSGSIAPSGNPYIRIGTLARASLTGGAPRAELEGVRFADLGPNNTLAVVRDGERRRTMEYPVGQVLAEMPILKSRSATGMVGLVCPRVSPSGDYVAFFDYRVSAAITVKIFDKSGKLVTESQSFQDWWGLAWTPSNEVWFGASEAGGRQVVVFSLDLQGRRRVVLRAPASLNLHDVSAQGDLLASYERVMSRVELIDPGGPQNRSWREGGYVAAFSRSHTLLLNGEGDSGGPRGSVYVWQPKDQQPVRIADGSGRALSPDGSRAVVVSIKAPVTVSIVPTGAGQPQVLDLGVVQYVSWAGWLPDGRLVIQFTRDGSGPVAYALSPAGKDPAALLPSGVTLRGDNLISPDGTRVAALDGEGRLVVCTIAAPVCQPVPGLEDVEDVAGWHADGRSLFVYQRQSSPVQIDRIELASGRRSLWKVIRPVEAAVGGVNRLIVAPDGAFVYGYDRTRSELYVIKGLK